MGEKGSVGLMVYSKLLYVVDHTVVQEQSLVTWTDKKFGSCLAHSAVLGTTPVRRRLDASKLVGILNPPSVQKYPHFPPFLHSFCSAVFSPDICLRVHDEIHSIKKPLKPCLLKYFKWLLSHRRPRAGKGLILFSNQYTNDN